MLDSVVEELVLSLHGGDKIGKETKNINTNTTIHVFVQKCHKNLFHDSMQGFCTYLFRFYSTENACYGLGLRIRIRVRIL